MILMGARNGHIGIPALNFFGSYELVRARMSPKSHKSWEKVQKVPKLTSNLRFR